MQKQTTICDGCKKEFLDGETVYQVRKFTYYPRRLWEIGATAVIFPDYCLTCFKRVAKAL